MAENMNFRQVHLDFHTSEKIEIPDEVVYPMSYVGKIGEAGFTITHALTATEGLLYLFDWEDYT